MGYADPKRYYSVRKELKPVVDAAGISPNDNDEPRFEHLGTRYWWTYASNTPFEFSICIDQRTIFHMTRNPNFPRRSQEGHDEGEIGPLVGRGWQERMASELTRLIESRPKVG